MIDLYDTEALIVDGIYGDDRMSRKQRDEAMAALAALVAEVERLRAEADEMRRWAEEAAHAENLNAQDAQKERAAVVAWLRKNANDTMTHPQTDRLAYARAYSALHTAADAIERGEHRREREPVEDDSIEYRDIAKED
jgi:hypothetical protein